LRADHVAGGLLDHTAAQLVIRIPARFRDFRLDDRWIVDSTSVPCGMSWSSVRRSTTLSKASSICRASAGADVRAWRSGPPY
jgi:hypothetical protein